MVDAGYNFNFMLNVQIKLH